MITRLALKNFRSYSSLNLSITDRITILLGPNGIGKTNILESVYYISLFHSFRAKDIEMIKNGSDFFVIEATFADDRLRTTFEISKLPHKQVFINDIKKTAQQMIGRYPVILFEPFDTELFHGSSEARRKLLDRLLMQIDNEYVVALMKYRKLIRMRNATLKQARTHTISRKLLLDQLFVYDLQIDNVAAIIVGQRKKIIEEMNQTISKSYEDISAKPIELEMSYDEKPFTHTRQSIDYDIVRAHTTTGPHRDDFSIKKEEKTFTLAASRGEIRTLLLAIKLAEYLILKKKRQISPILLLDDVFSELDESRTENLLAHFDQTQIIITTTEKPKKTPSGVNCVNVENLIHGSH